MSCNDDQDTETSFAKADSTWPARALYEEWRNPRRGSSNPHEMTNLVWKWLIETETNPYAAAAGYDAPNAFEAGPGWTICRNGMSSTQLPDGSEVLIAGEHEDYYDPDFYIYNDVIVKSADGTIKIFCYPEDVFPPTDFHSATLVKDKIYIVGSLGYPTSRQPSTTQVCVLDLHTWKMTKLITDGEPPHWLSEHEATLDKETNTISVSRGQLYTNTEEAELLENIDDYALNLEKLEWKRLTNRQWTRFVFSGGEGLGTSEEPAYKKFVSELMRDNSEPKAPDMSSFVEFAAVGHAIDHIQPSVPFEPIAGAKDEDGCDDEPFVKRFKVNGVIVRYQQDYSTWTLTIEGDLSRNTVTTLRDDLRSKLEKFFEVEVSSKELKSPE